eukprot:jgi/Bigna1/91436/estExt_fgenesh1_pg.C_1000063
MEMQHATFLDAVPASTGYRRKMHQAEGKIFKISHLSDVAFSSRRPTFADHRNPITERHSLHINALGNSSGRSSKGSVPRTPRSSLGKRDISSPQPTSQNVRVNVCVRVRPLNALEKRTKQVDAWSYGNDEIFQTYIPWDKDKESKRKSKKKEVELSASFVSVSWRTRAMNFRFDKIFLPEENNEDIHDYVGTKVVDFVMKGYHGCLFAYGQTSAGKTHTIHGAKTDGDTPSDKQSEIREKKARIDQLMRVILKSSKATMPKEMNQVICEKLQKGQISLDEFTHIRRVIAASQKTEDLPSGMRRPSGIRRPTSRAFETKTFVKRSTSFADKFSAAQNSKKKMLANSNVEEMLETLKEVSEAQAIEISRLNKENEELRRMNAEKDEALNEWDMYYQNEQNKPTHDTDQLAAQLLAMETKMETDTAKHQSEVARLQEEIERLKSGRLGSSTSTTTTTTTTTAQIAKGSGESDGEQLLPAPFRLFD